MKHFVRTTVLCVAVFLWGSVQLQAQKTAADTRETVTPSFSAEVGIGANLLPNYGQMLSPQGVHYRNQYNPVTGAYVQLNYVFRNRDMLGIRYAGYSTMGNYDLATGQRMAENIRYQYVAPQYGFLQPVTRRANFLLTVGVGYLNYKNDGLMDNTEVKVVSHMLGVNAGLALDWQLTRNFSVGCRIDALGGFLGDKQHRTIGNETNRVETNRWNTIRVTQLDLGIYLRGYF